MRLTIIRSDGFVSIDGKGYSGLNLSLLDNNIHAIQWTDTSGVVEYIETGNGRPANKIITDLNLCYPAITAWEKAYEEELNTVEKPLTPEEIKYSNKALAESLLQQTDWTATVDVSNPEYSNPYLGNQSEFLSYRSDVRKIAVNPPVTVDAWPVKPDEVWVNVE